MIKPLWQLGNPDPNLDLSHWGVGRGVKSQLTKIVQGKERRADSLKVQASQRGGTSPNQDHWKCRQVSVPTRTRCNYKVIPGSQCKCNGSSHLHVDPKAKCKITSSFQCKRRVTSKNYLTIDNCAVTMSILPKQIFFYSSRSMEDFFSKPITIFFGEKK